MKLFDKKFLILILCVCLDYSAAVFKFTNIECEMIGKSNATFETCRLKAINRYENAVNIKVNIPEPIAGNITMNYQIMQRLNGWKPFLYNITIDACKFLERPNNPVLLLTYKTLKAHSTPKNIKCPIQGTISFENVTNVSSENWIKDLPIPAGNYGEFTTWFVGGIPKASVKIYHKF